MSQPELSPYVHLRKDVESSDDQSTYYDVYWDRLPLGAVYLDREAWSDGRWFIHGVPQRIETSKGATAWRSYWKPRGYYSRAAAVQALVRSKSNEIMRYASALEEEGQANG